MLVVLLAAALAAEPDAPAPENAPRFATTADDGTVLAVSRARAPSHPDGAPWSGADVACTVRLVVTPGGRPHDLVAEGCPPAFAEEARRAVAQWRWEERTEGDQDAPVTLTLTFPGKPLEETPAEDAPMPAGGGVRLVQGPIPAVPDEAMVYGSGARFACVADVVLKPSGMPRTVAISACPELFHLGVEKAVRRWRWVREGDGAPTLDGLALSVTVDLRVP